MYVPSGSGKEEREAMEVLYSRPIVANLRALCSVVTESDVLRTAICLIQFDIRR